VSAWRTRFGRFIALDATGALIEVEDHHHGGHGHDDDEDDMRLVPEYAYRGVRAQLTGAELEGRVRLLDRPWTLDASAVVDLVRGDNLDSGEPLARLAPLRVSLGLDAQAGALELGARVRHAARQSRVPATDEATAGYTLLDVSLSWRQHLGGAEALWFLRVDNLTDRLATNAVAISTVRNLSPLPGRAVAGGVRVRF
jgi:iron complex outermembrane recepter protein